VQLWGICLARAHRCSSLSILLGLARDGIRTEDLLEDPGERRNLDCARDGRRREGEKHGVEVGSAANRCCILQRKMHEVVRIACQNTDLEQVGEEAFCRLVGHQPLFGIIIVDGSSARLAKCRCNCFGHDLVPEAV